MWESRMFLAGFPRGLWKGWEACLRLSMLSTAPAFPRLSAPSEFCRGRRVFTAACCAVGVGLLWAGVFLLLAAFETVALAVHLQDVDVMRQPVQQRARQPLRAQDLRPFGKRLVRCHQRRAALIALAEDLEQHLGPRLRQRHEAQFIDDEQFLPDQVLLEPQQALLIPGLHQLCLLYTS